MSQARTPPHGDHRHQLGGGTLPARHTRDFGDNTQAPVWPYFQCQRMSPPASRLYMSHWASSPGYGAGGPYYGGQGGRSDNFVVDYHHSSGGNFGSGPPPLLGDSRLQRRRESFSASPSTARVSAPNLSTVDRDSNTARRRLDYLPRHQMTVPLSVSEPTVMHPETRVGSRDRPCAEAQDQMTAERREEEIQDTSGGQATAVSLGQTSVGDGNPAPADHQAGIRGLAEQAIAPSTLKTYQSAWRRWLLFSRQKDQSEAGQQDAMLAFMWDRYSEGDSRTTMASTLAGISFMAKLHGYPDVTKGFLINKALRGWGRVRPSHADTRLPITSNILEDLIGNVGSVTLDSYEKLLFSLAFSMAYFGAFRISELVARSRGHQESGLRVEHVSLGEGILACKIVKSKTDQSGRGSWVQLTSQQPCLICPVRLASLFMSKRPHANLFLCHANGIPLTKYQFATILKRTLQSINLNSTLYGTHSFRIGAATSAALAGSSSEAIKALGRWKSAAFKSYVRIDKVVD
ncbi:uncharacterized protein LOC142098485 [Mixophyes fleayi]|uniref:uncharacterized protein LOC142098485 n=1 Tax=Mixophyes fleayi TaxID=3061075 RepID=UPI003F4DE377